MNEFLNRFAGESVEVLLPIFMEFATRFNNAISGRATKTEMARVIGSFNIAATQKMVTDGDRAAQIANGNYELFKLEMIRIYTTSLETQNTDYFQTLPMQQD